jgi:hypothetical protein
MKAAEFNKLTPQPPRFPYTDQMHPVRLVAVDYQAIRAEA